MNVSWDDAQLFLAVAEAASISGAARRLSVQQPTVTRRLALLEHHLGTKLFRRSTTGVTLTAAGERLVLPARRMAEWAGAFAQVAQANDTAPQGVVRISAPPLFAATLLPRCAAVLQQRFPGIVLEVSSEVRRVDLARGEAELALRTEPAHHADLLTVASWRGEAAVYAAPSLQAKLPKRPAVAALPWVAWAAPFDDVPPNPQLRAAVPNFRPVFTADSFLVLVAAVEAGVGAMALPRWKLALPSATSLVPLNVSLGPAGATSMHVVCAKSAMDLPRVRAVAQVLERALVSGALASSR